MVFSLLAFAAEGQDSVARGGLRVNLVSSWGGGYSVFRDFGTSPLLYRGPAVAGQLGVSLEWPRWRLEPSLFALGGAYMNRYQARFSTTNMGATVGLDVRSAHRVARRGPIDLWVGAALVDAAGLRYNPNLNNSSTTVDNFAWLDLSLRAELAVGRWCFHSELAVAPVALAMRPGYAFIENYQAVNHDVFFLARSYTIEPVAFAHWATDVGVCLSLAGGNSMALSYRWQLLTSRSSGSFRLDEAAHTLLVTFNFNLN
ncbi:MAG: hypothetical protein IJ789_01590 [Bacteroidales bacterium]|nr:hypothetical protein [Bacteroidales bacterium]